MKRAITTVVTKEFVPGTLVTLSSFLSSNPSFDGDIVLIGVDVNWRFIKRTLGYKKLQYLEVSQDLIDRCEKVCEVHEQYRRRVAQFYSLEIFRLEGYDRILFLDSDLLIRGELDELWSNDQAILVCGDGYYYKGFSHDRKTFEKIDHPAEDKLGGMNAFNAGVMSIPGQLLTKSNLKSLRSFIVVDYFNQFATNHSDQLIFNMVFEKQAKFVNAKYNYRIGITEEIKRKDDVDLENAIVIHYTAQKKPWRLMGALRASRLNETFYRTYMMWHEEWQRIMKRMS